MHLSTYIYTYQPQKLTLSFAFLAGHLLSVGSSLELLSSGSGDSVAYLLLGPLLARAGLAGPLYLFNSIVQ